MATRGDAGDLAHGRNLLKSRRRGFGHGTWSGEGSRHGMGSVPSCPESCWHPSVAGLLLAGRNRWETGERDDPFQVEPLYLRPSAAEEQWDRRKVDSKAQTLPEKAGTPFWRLERLTDRMQIFPSLSGRGTQRRRPSLASARTMCNSIVICSSTIKRTFGSEVESRVRFRNLALWEKKPWLIADPILVRSRKRTSTSLPSKSVFGSRLVEITVGGQSQAAARFEPLFFLWRTRDFEELVDVSEPSVGRVGL